MAPSVGRGQPYALEYHLPIWNLGSTFRFHSDGESSPTMAWTIKRLRKGKGQGAGQATYSLDDLDRVICEYETEREMSSANFTSRWDSGQLDHGDFGLSRWALLLAARARAAASVNPPTAAP